MTAPITAVATAADCTPEWRELRRSIIVRDGKALRAGPDATIQISTLRPDIPWMLLALPNNATRFASAADRDEVLRFLQEGR